jgi:AhpD family alkylhydroperoxidase
MLLDWRAFIQATTAGIKDLARLSPSTLKGYQTLHAAGGQTQHLDAKTRELIALAVAVTTRCDGCIADHTKNAIALGVTREEIAEALGVAIAMNAGAALTYAGRVMDAYTGLTVDPPQA